MFLRKKKKKAVFQRLKPWESQPRGWQGSFRVLHASRRPFEARPQTCHLFFTMGVSGLLQQLKEIQTKQSLSSYKGKTLAVDTYGWLHRGLILCAQDLCTDAPTRGYVTSVMKKVDMLRHFGVEPYMVFDGLPLPTKEGTHVERRQKREKAREAAAQYLKKGDRKSAWKEFMKAAEVTPEMAKSIMVELDRKNVKYVVAPYEADPQMVYLEKIGKVDGILSEDSDLLVFGCRKLITKLNDYGECIEIDRANLHRVGKLGLDKYTSAQWRLVAILSGCDYTKGIPGVGLKTAFNTVAKIQSLDKIILSFRAEKRSVPEDFLEEAFKADLAFQFQKVFDPVQQVCTTICEIPADLGVDPELIELCCGRTLERSTHVGICTGKLHPGSYKLLISREHNLKLAKSQSYLESRPVSIEVAAPRSKSFAGARCIEDYFNATSLPGRKPLVKRENIVSAKLSPNTKKLRRVLAACEQRNNTHSKFFSAESLPVLSPEASNLGPKLLHVDSSFLTGDSDVPESSSPVRNDNVAQITLYLTDDDEEEFGCHSILNSVSVLSLTSSTLLKLTSLLKLGSDNEDEHQYELEESPEKRSHVARSWRERFSMGSKFQLQKKDAVKVTNEPIHGGSTAESSSESAASPATDSGTSHLKPEPDALGCPSSDRNYLSESEDEPSVQLPSKSTFKLLRFAFAG